VTPFLVMTWNVRYFSQSTGGLRSTDAHLRRAAWALATHDPLPDAIALQEVEDGSLRGGSAPQASRFHQALHAALEANRRSRRFTLTYFPAHRYRLGEASLYTTGLAWLVRDDLPIEQARRDDITVVRLRAFARWKQRRIAARVRVRPPGWAEPLVLCNTHLSLPAFLEVGPLALPRKMGHGSNQVGEVENLLAALDDGLPTVVVGDFNSEPGSPAFRRMEAAGWRPAEVPDATTAAFLHHRMHLDHAFARGARFGEVRIAGGALAGLSDHRPKVAAVLPC
jgi:endonuclease/exonuclease/phosphatase family metal-dependent hydrolase